MQYYAYLHARPTGDTALSIFYVGKGKGKRARELNRSNPHHRNIVEKYGCENIRISTIPCSSEKIALELEVGLIKRLTRMGVSLANKTSGGDGVSGYKHTTEWKEYHSSLMKGRQSPTKGVAKSAEHAAKIAETLRKTTPWRGRKHTDEARAKMGANLGTKLVNKNGSVKRIRVSDLDLYLADKWVCGLTGTATNVKPSVVGKARKGRIYITDGIKTSCIRVPLLPTVGWKFGITRKKGKR